MSLSLANGLLSLTDRWGYFGIEFKVTDHLDQLDGLTPVSVSTHKR